MKIRTLKSTFDRFATLIEEDLGGIRSANTEIVLDPGEQTVKLSDLHTGETLYKYKFEGDLNEIDNCEAQLRNALNIA